MFHTFVVCELWLFLWKHICGVELQQCVHCRYGVSGWLCRISALHFVECELWVAAICQVRGLYISFDERSNTCYFQLYSSLRHSPKLVIMYITLICVKETSPLTQREKAIHVLLLFMLNGTFGWFCFIAYVTHSDLTLQELIFCVSMYLWTRLETILLKKYLRHW